MTFWQPSNNVIESDEGFSVEVLGRVGMLYREGNRSLHISSEVIMGPAIALFAKSIKEWQSPDGPRAVSGEEKERIVENIRRAFVALNQRLEID
jgi:hypothetical protein